MSAAGAPYRWDVRPPVVLRRPRGHEHRRRRRSTSSPPSRSPRATRTRCATRSRTPILDAFIRQDPQARVACETATTTGLVLVLGEITTKAEYVDVQTIVRETVQDIGYTKAEYGFDYLTCGTLVSIKEQSAGHRAGRRRRARGPRRRGAGVRARRRRPGDDVRLRLPRDARADAAADRARPPDGAPARRGPQDAASCRTSARTARPRSRSSTSAASRSGCETVVVSTQHDPDVRAERLRSGHRRSGHPADDPRASSARHDPVMHVNPTGRFVIGGPMGDAGPDRPQDHRRHLRRHGPPRRRRVLAARTRRRSTARPRTRPAGSPRTWSRPGSPTASRSRSPTGSASPGRSACRVDSFGTGTIADAEILTLIERHFDLRPASIIAAPRPAPADLPPDRGVRPLRPRRTSTCRGSGPTRRALLAVGSRAAGAGGRSPSRA